MKSLDHARANDSDWRGGKVSGLVYYANDDILNVAKDAYRAYFSENALGPKAFPSLARFETEVVSMVASLLGADQAGGSVTSGGTESILLAVKTVRDYARTQKPYINAPTIVLPRSAHPAFDKAAHYFGLRTVRVPVADDFRVDVDKMRAAVSDDTVLLVGSAPCYPYGVIDPIEDIAAIARKGDICMHVDACVGGLFLPFLENVSPPLPAFDFRVAGVTSMSADLHKYGYTAKGASVILWRDAELGQFQRYEFRNWPRGTYSTPTMTGTRPGGALAAAWAVMQFLGKQGYLQLAETTMKTVEKLTSGIDSIPGLHVWGKPPMSIFSYGSEEFDIFAVADGMTSRGWYVNRLQEPHGIHMNITASHAAIADAYLKDLASVSEDVRRRGLKSTETEIRYA